MNLALSDEQVFLREAARGALSRLPTVEAAREALDGNPDALPDLWPTAREAGWPGLLIDEAHGGAGLDAFDAMLVLGECGRVLAGVALLGHLPATAILSASSPEGDAPGVTIEPVTRYDATRSLGHVTLEDAPAVVLDCPEESLAGAWHLAQSLIAAESLGSVETALDVTVAYAKERHTFGRAIGSYQAVKHALTEVLRQLENGRSLLYYAGWARTGAPGEFPLAASAARSVAGRALDDAARTMISVHGGIGATWEHDAPLYFRRAQLSRRLLGGTAGATDRVAGELLRQAA